MVQPLKFKPWKKMKLADFDPDDISRTKNREVAARELKSNRRALANLSHRLYAENKRSLLIVLQGIDTAGKDGTIRHVTHGINPQVCRVSSFKQPSPEELAHDFLWRIHRETPRHGSIGIFNRSHYEDVLVVRVHQIVPQAQWSHYYARINEFEKLLTQGGMTLIKCFLHISKDEQKKRLQARLSDPTRGWKFSLQDVAERKFWNDYQAAYATMLEKCSTRYAPWHVIPANNKWYRNLLVSRIIRRTLERLNPAFPQPDANLEGVTID